jgi:hypothetical protein
VVEARFGAFGFDLLLPRLELLAFGAERGDRVVLFVVRFRGFSRPPRTTEVRASREPGGEGFVVFPQPSCSLRACWERVYSAWRAL